MRKDGNVRWLIFKTLKILKEEGLINKKLTKVMQLEVVAVEEVEVGKK